jgi:hypothetical protein
MSSFNSTHGKIDTKNVKKSIADNNTSNTREIQQLRNEINYLKQQQLQNHVLISGVPIKINADIIKIVAIINNIIESSVNMDDVYVEKLEIHTQQRTKWLLREWIISFMNAIVSTSKIPNLFKRAKVIAIIKPGKDGTDPAHYRSISLLSIVYKLLECLILQRIQPLIENVTPINQAGFRKHRSCTEQVMALTTHIEAGFNIN